MQNNLKYEHIFLSMITNDKNKIKSGADKYQIFFERTLWLCQIMNNTNKERAIALRPLELSELKKIFLEFNFEKDMFFSELKRYEKIFEPYSFLGKEDILFELCNFFNNNWDNNL